MLEDIRDCPGTLSLGASWILVFALCLAMQGLTHTPVPPSSMVGPLPVAPVIAHRFGSMTWAEVQGGEAWRLLTATFVHYGLLHVGMNLLSLFMLGRLIEPWYGAGPFLGICLTIGGLGNLIGGLIRQFLATARPWVVASAAGRHWPGLYDQFFHVGPDGPTHSSGGGSTIVLGLIGLAAVVGWRSRTRIGAYLSRQMLALLVFTAILGVVFYQLIDNYGHTGGAIVGAAIGFAHRPLIRVAERKSFRRLAWFAAGMVSLVCVAAAVRDDRADQSIQRRLIAIIRREQAIGQTLIDLERLYAFHARTIRESPFYRDPANELDAAAVFDLLRRGPAASMPSQPDPARADRDRAEARSILERLGKPEITPPPWDEATAADLDRLRDLGLASLEAAPGFPEAYEFDVTFRSATKSLLADLTRAKAELLQVDRLARSTR